MLNHQPPFLKPPVLNALWQLCERTSAEPGSARGVRNGLVIISMAAAKQPSLVSARLDLLLKVGRGGMKPTVVAEQPGVPAMVAKCLCHGPS
jgi:hypothetical protein